MGNTQPSSPVPPQNNGLAIRLTVSILVLGGGVAAAFYFSRLASQQPAKLSAPGNSAPQLASQQTASQKNLGIETFHKNVEPILKKYCYDCHGEGAKSGNVAFDQLRTDSEIVNPTLWLKVLKNLRAGIMPPKGETRPPAEEIAKIESWVKSTAFGVDQNNPDPGRVTLHRLNRAEYENTIRDLM